MSDSGGGKRIEAIAITGFSAVIIFGVLLLLYSVGLLNGEQTERRNNYPHTHSESAKQQAKRACVGTNPAAVFECVVDYVESSEDTAYTEQDLTAQQRAAWGALIAAFAGLLSVGASVLGLYWIKGTLDATRDAVAETGKATVAMQQSNLIAEDTAKKQLRAYLDIFDIDEAIERRTDWDSNGFIQYKLWIPVMNFGQTPARNVQSFFYAQSSSHPLGTVKFPQIQTHSIYDIPAQGKHTEIIPFGITQNVLDAILSGEGAVYVFAFMAYEDVYGEPHHLKFTLCARETMFTDKVMGVYRDSYEST